MARAGKDPVDATLRMIFRHIFAVRITPPILIAGSPGDLPGNEAEATTMTDATKQSSGHAPRAALFSIALGLGGLAAAAFTSDMNFASGLERALAEQASTKARRVVAAPVVGSEAFWLTKPAGHVATGIQPAAFVAKVARGDRFDFAGAGGKRVLEVVDVQEIAPDTRDGAKPGKPQLLISFKDIAGSSAPAVRMLVDADAPLAGLAPVSREVDRAL